jgi:hypothetical protein
MNGKPDYLYFVGGDVITTCTARSVRTVQPALPNGVFVRVKLSILRKPFGLSWLFLGDLTH